MMRKSLTASASLPRLNRFSTGVRNKNTVVPIFLTVNKSTLSQSFSHSSFSRNFSSNRSVGLEIVSPLIGLTGKIRLLLFICLHTSAVSMHFRGK